jgi:hypothetical protein
MEIINLIEEIAKGVNPKIEHNDTVKQIEQIFQRYGFYTTKEYPIYKIKDKSGRARRIDLVARKGKFRAAIEYDHKYNVKYKSFQKIVQIKPDVAIGITGLGFLSNSLTRAEKYIGGVPIYVVSLKQHKYKLLEEKQSAFYIV